MEIGWMSYVVEDNMLKFEDGHVEYYSTWSNTKGLAIFPSMQRAINHIDNTNDHFGRGVMFHKELDGQCILPSTLRGE